MPRTGASRIQTGLGRSDGLRPAEGVFFAPAVERTKSLGRFTVCEIAFEISLHYSNLNISEYTDAINPIKISSL